MISFAKKVDKMSENELRGELTATRQIIDDIYDVAKDATKGKAETAAGKQNIINQIARYCYRSMPD